MARLAVLSATTLYLAIAPGPASADPFPNIVTGTAGADVIEGTDISDIVWAHEGDDIVRGHGSYDGLHGMAGDDTLFGNEGDDSLSGDDGNDTLWGDIGDDHLDGGPGADVLNGGDGDDFVQGREGVDRLDGGAGNDELDGREDDDVIYGRDGNDLLSDGVLMVGGEGNDTLAGGSGHSRMEGGPGNDVLRTGVGNDVLDGGTGNDVLCRGAEGGATLIGGPGNDIACAEPDEANLAPNTRTVVETTGNDQVLDDEHEQSVPTKYSLTAATAENPSWITATIDPDTGAIAVDVGDYNAIQMTDNVGVGDGMTPPTELGPAPFAEAGFGYIARRSDPVLGTVETTSWLYVVVDRPTPLDVDVPPTVDGTEKAGQVLVATTPQFGPAAQDVDYQWLRGSTPISGATASSYRLRAADVGSTVAVRTIGRHDSYISRSVRSDASATSRGSSSGTRPAGRLVTASGSL